MFFSPFFIYKIFIWYMYIYLFLDLDIFTGCSLPCKRSWFSRVAIEFMMRWSEMHSLCAIRRKNEIAESCKSNYWNYRVESQWMCVCVCNNANKLNSIDKNISSKINSIHLVHVLLFAINSFEMFSYDCYYFDSYFHLK